MANLTQTPQTYTPRGLRHVLPIAQWLPAYNPSWLGPELLAAVTLSAFAIPEGMAYATLAGLPPQVGLYAGLLAPLAYALFGTSRQLAVGPTSALSILVAAGLAGLTGETDPARYAALAALMALLVGAIAIAAWVFRLGFLVNFISESVLTGFSAGAAIYIASTQLGKLLGIHGARGEFFERIAYLSARLGETHLPSLLLGLAGVAVLLLAEEWLPKLPAALLVVLLSIALISFTGLGDLGIEITGEIPRGLPQFALPSVSLADVSALLPGALAVFLLAYVEGMGMVRTFAKRHSYPIDANQELLALGATNLLCGLGSAFAVGGSMSRSAVNDNSGAQTPLAGAMSSLILVLVLLFLTGLFTNLPEPILGAVVLVAVKGLFDAKELRRLFGASRSEFRIAMVALFGVLLFGMLEGVLLGVVLSLLVLVARATYPHTAVLGKIPGSDVFSDVARHPENEQIPGVLVYRVDAGLFYANAPTIEAEVLRLVDNQTPPPGLLVFDLASSPRIDLAAADMLKELHDDLGNRGTTLTLAHADGQVRDLLRQAGLAETFGPLGPHQSIPAVIDQWQRSQPPTPGGLAP
ncbi:sulfate permease [Nodosilinea sp. P-1105]|uniref:SulP family inorganic anion transporter n=1 Tax=Nodosilinea sp. P-1105 TaxID=2546229 RepID=UPI00146B3833|nr:sulfate permease [Nodosilinea sp. P-1105]NMF85868.1 sulfate permease [Nodosilinea sp. P-1105]